MKSLEARDYVATTADIEALARQNLEAREAHVAVRSTYLRALVSTAQHELAKHGHTRALHVVETVHAGFYAIILRVAITPEIRDSERLAQAERTKRSLERNRRTGFARSAKSTLMHWLKVPGHDLRSLVAAKVTKRGLAMETPKSSRRPRPALLRRQTAGAAKKLTRLVDNLAKADPEGAIGVLNAALRQIQAKLAGLTRRKAA